MIDRVKLLISGLGGSLFPYLENKLAAYYETFYVDSNDQLSYLYPKLRFFPSPPVKDSKYLDFLRGIVEENRINFYIPLIDEEIVSVKSSLDGFKNVAIISPTCEFSSLCLDKHLLMMRLNELGISSVNSIRGNEFNGQISFPVFMKPISGRGSRGAYKIDSNQQFKAYFSLFCSKKEEILVQPLLTGTEYTVGVLCNNKNDLISISSKRIIQKRGITLLAVTENNHKIDELAKRIVKELKPGGPFNIQLMITPNDEIKIFEINPRFSTTSILDYEAGIDLVSLYIQFKDRNYDQPIKYPTERIRIHRRWESLFYDEK